jgi:hypothetical protein
MAEQVETDVWKEIRGVLKTGLLAGTIPLEPKEMRPKEVYQELFVDATIIDYQDKKTQEKFCRMLRSLRAKQKNGDLENEDDSSKPIVWAKSAAKQVLRTLFRDGTISTALEDTEIEQIWNDHCNDHPAFKRMAFNEAFVRRIKSVRDDHQKKVMRCEEDLTAYTAAKANHPTPELNRRGEPQWHRSEAQRLLKELIAREEHVGKQPRDLWDANNEFQIYSLNIS